ncbi:DUF397 domain-containing protein [Streptomyces sp. NPDC020379]|uniref:DUF397 domain-containing protein n=1 Tax=Streptomyces sp. NPDC020379 TaxID=3365071 RepID=UPI00379505C7
MCTSRPDLPIAAWRKSSYSLNENACVEVAVWRKSTYSGLNDSDCVEVATHQFPDIVPIRDSKNPDGPVITPPTAAWSTFITAIASATDLQSVV